MRQYPVDPRPWVRYIVNCKTICYCDAQNYVVVAQSIGDAEDLARRLHAGLSTCLCTGEKIQLRNILDLTPEEWQVIYDYNKSRPFDNLDSFLKDAGIEWPHHIRK